MKQKFLLSFAAIGLAGSIVGCRSASVDDSGNSGFSASDPQADAFESAVTMISGQADDSSGETFAYQKTAAEAKYSAVNSLIFSSAHADNCGRAYNQSCNNADGTKSIRYTDCSIAGRGFTLNGWINLSYSNNSCSLGVGENVLRTYDHVINGPRGGAIETTSELRSDYRGTQIGGGGRLSHTATNVWMIEILGKHKIGTLHRSLASERTLFDVSARTISPLTISGALDRSGRTLTSGSVEINHNIAKFTAVYSVTQPLVWNSTCCHPVSGSVNATYSGSVSGSGAITFNGCGSAELSKDGSTRTLSIGYCE